MLLDRYSEWFEAESVGEAARRFKRAVVALVATVVLWALVLRFGASTMASAAVPAWVAPVLLVVGVLCETVVVAAVVRTAIEYLVWVRQSVEWL